MSPADELPTLDPSQQPTSAPEMSVEGERGWTSAATTTRARVVGSFTLLRPLGAGGMGEVWEAEQARPRRKVALKLVRSDLLTLSLRRRFEFEAEVLGRLDHDGIARIYEAGIDAPTGRPYFAMELVEGRRLDDASVIGSLDRRARLSLFVKLCRGVQAAHQRGVVHRDLKPANVLVRTDGQPKILDFGIARLNDTDAAVTRQTQAGAIVGTLAYMSPEQASGESDKVDTRSDVYALGVILYQLLTERLPIDLGGVALHTAARMIVEQEPAKASRVDRTLRGDLDTIVRRAMEKDPARRYASADALADDVERHLRHEPILARPPSTLYLLGKFVRRRKALSISAAVIALSIVGISSALAVAIVRAADARRNEQFYDGLFGGLTQSLSPQAAGFASISGRALFEQSLERHLAQIESMPGVSAERSAGHAAKLLGDVANMMIDVGDLNAASRAIERGEAKLDHAGRYAKDASLGLFLARCEVSLRRGEAQAIDQLRSKLRELEQSGEASPSINLVRSRLADALKNSSRGMPIEGRLASLDEAESIYQAYLRSAPSPAGDDEAWRVAFDLAQLPIERAGALREAGRTFEDVHDDLMEAQGQLAALRGLTLSRPIVQQVELESEWAKLQHRLRRPRSADEAYRTVVPRMVEVLSADHWRTQQVLLSWATLHRKPPAPTTQEASTQGLSVTEMSTRRLEALRTILRTQLKRAEYAGETYDVALDLAEVLRETDREESSRWIDWVIADVEARHAGDRAFDAQRERARRLKGE